jgi:hypothetical protein
MQDSNRQPDHANRVSGRPFPRSRGNRPELPPKQATTRVQIKEGTHVPDSASDGRTSLRTPRRTRHAIPAAGGPVEAIGDLRGCGVEGDAVGRYPRRPLCFRRARADQPVDVVHTNDRADINERPGEERAVINDAPSPSPRTALRYDVPQHAAASRGFAEWRTGIGRLENQPPPKHVNHSRWGVCVGGVMRRDVRAVVRSQERP